MKKLNTSLTLFLDSSESEFCGIAQTLAFRWVDQAAKTIPELIYSYQSWIIQKLFYCIFIIENHRKAKVGLCVGQ